MPIPQSGAGGSGQPRDWVPPTDVERALLEAKSRGDWDGYARVLAREELFTYVSQGEQDRTDGKCPPPTYGDPAGGESYAVYTRGLLSHVDGLVLREQPFPPPAADTRGGGRTGLLVNPHSPAAAFFPWDRGLWQRWEQLAREAPQRGHDDDALLTKYTGPLTGALAHGLACGTHLSVHNQVLWNEIGDVFHDYPTDRAILEDSWDVTDRDGWIEQLGYLLRGENSPPHPEFALDVRSAIVRHYPDRPVDPQMWREVAVDNLRDREVSQDAVDMVLEAIGQILRYEARFRADGLLPPNGFVTSALGYDYGRAVNFARWGLGARYAEVQETEQAVLRAGELCRETYTSWTDFSAGYILGRALRFDEESFGHMYGSALSPHRILTGDPGSPWLNIPFSHV